MLSPCAAGSKPLLSAACPVGRPHGLLALGHWVAKVPFACVRLTAFMSVWFFLKCLYTSPVNTSSELYIWLFLLIFHFSLLVSWKSLHELVLFHIFGVFRRIFLNLSEHSTKSSINFHLSVQRSMRIWSSGLIIEVLFSFLVRPFWRFMLHFCTGGTAFSCIISTACPNTHWVIFGSLNITWMAIAFWNFRVFRLSFPVRNWRVSYVVLTTKPVWIRRDSFVRCRLRIYFSMINAELWRSIFWSSLMLSFSTSRSIPWRPATSPALRP